MSERTVVEVQKDAWDLVCAGDELGRWVADHCGIEGILAVGEIWRSSGARTRNRCWKVDESTLSDELHAALDEHKLVDNG